jgi:hypothetical protein
MDLLHDIRDGVAHVVNLAPDQRVDGRSSAVERDHRCLRPDEGIEQQASKVCDRANARVCDVQLVGIGFQIRDEFVEVVWRKVLSGHDQNRLINDEADGSEIDIRPVSKVWIKRDGGGVGPYLSPSRSCSRPGSPASPASCRWSHRP